MIESDRFRVMAGAGSGWRRGGSLHRKRPTDGKGKAAPSGARKWLVGLRFSAIRSEGADGSRGIFFKEFNAPTAIHWLPPRASDHEHLRRRLPCEPRPHRGGDRGAKRPTSFVAEVMRAVERPDTSVGPSRKAAEGKGSSCFGLGAVRRCLWCRVHPAGASRVRREPGVFRQWPDATELDQGQIRPEEKVADRETPPVGDPTLCQVMRPIVQHVAALAERTEVPQPVVGRVAVQVRGREHDARLPIPGRLDEIRPPGCSPTAIAPRGCPLVEPASVRQAADQSEMRPPAALAPAARSKRTRRLSSRQCGG